MEHSTQYSVICPRWPNMWMVLTFASLFGHFLIFSPAVQQMVALFAQNLGRASTATLQVGYDDRESGLVDISED